MSSRFLVRGESVRTSRANKARILLATAASAASLLLLGHEARATARTWTGTNDNTFNTAGNWGGTLPGTGDSLSFGSASSAGGNLNNNAAFNISGITFNSGAAAFNLGNGTLATNVGNSVILTGGITDNATNAETINFPVTFTSSQTITASQGGGSLTLAGTISGAGVTLTTNNGTGGADVASNTYFTGTVNVASIAAQGNSGNGFGYSSNPTTTFNGNANLTTTGNVTLGRSNLVFSGNAVAYIGGTLGNIGATSIDWSTLTISGNANVTAVGGLNMDGNGTSGIAYLNGGTLTTPSIKGVEQQSVTYGTAQFIEFNGTQIIASANNAAFVTMVPGSGLGGSPNTNAAVGTGGAIFNTSSYNIGISVPLVDYTSGGTLSVLGSTGSLTLSGANTFTGNVNISGGTLIANYANSSSTPTASALGAPNTAHTVSIYSGGTLNFNQSNVLGINSNVGIATSIIAYAGSNITEAAGTANTLGPINLSGGTITSSTGGTYYFRNSNFYVSGSSASTMASTGSGSGFNMLSVGSGGTTFNVASTGAVGGDLLVTGNLLNSATNSAGELIKTGPGTMVLSGTNAYTGATIVNAGTLVFSNASSIASVGLTNNATTVFGANASLPSLNGTATTAVTNISGNTLTITGGGSYAGSFLGTGSVNFSGGTMALKSTTSIGPSLSVASTTLNLQDGVTAALNVGGSLNLSGSTLNLDLGTGGTYDSINVLGSGGAAVSGTNKINFDLITGQTLSAGHYNVITASSGLGATFTLGTTPAGFNQYNLSSTATTVTLNVAAKAPVPVLYWTGSASSTGSPTDPNNNWGYGSGLSTVQSNWSNVSSGSVDALNVPGSITDVYFTAANATASSGTTLNTTLDGSYSMQGLFIATPSSSITAVGINTSGYSLAIGSDGLNVSSGSFAGATISGTGSVILSSSQNWANNNSLPLNVSTGITANSGATTLTLNGTGNGGVTLGGTIGNGGGTLALVLGQAGTTYLNGNNTFTGGVTINSGIVQLGNAGALNSTTPNAITFGSGSTGDLRLNGNSISVASLNTNATVGTPIVENYSATPATLSVKLASGTSTFAGTIQDGTGGGALSLTQTGAGTLILSGSVSYSGATTINSGSTLIISGASSTTGATTINSGANLTLSGSSTATGAINVTNNGTLTLIANASNLTGAFSSVIGSPSALNYANDLYTTYVQLRGDTDVNFVNASPTGGTGGYPDFTIMNFDVNNVGGASTATNHTLTLYNTTSGAVGFGTYNTYINVTGGNGYTLGIPAITNANNTFLNLNASTGNLIIPGGITSVSTLTVRGAGNTSIGTITGTNVTMSGTGTLSLTGISSSYTGITDIKSGIVNFASIANEGSNSALGNITSTLDAGSTVGLLFEGGTIQYTGTTAQSTNRQIRILAGTTATIDASGNNSTGATLSFTATTAANLFETAGIRTLQLTGTNTGQNIFAIPITNQGSNATSFIKSGTGTWVLTGSNTFTGSTQITGGTLSLNSSTAVLTSTPLINIAAGATLDISNNPVFALSSGATLAGSGTVNGFYNHSAGILSPGGTGSIGTLSFNNDLTLNGGVLNFDLNGSSTTIGSGVNDLIAVTGNLNLSTGTTSTLTVSATPTPAINSIYKVISYTGSLNGTGLLVAPNRAYSVITSQAGYVELEYTGGAAANLVWNSTSSQNWDTSTQNWYNTGTHSPDLFYSGDNVAFNDSTASPVSTPQTTINLSSTVLPTSVTFNNNVNSYALGGTGSIGGAATFIKNGSNTLTVSNSNGYTGDTSITNGTVIVNSTTGAGLGSGNLNVSSSAIVQIGDGGADGSLNNPNINLDGTLVYNSTASTALSGTIVGNGGINVNAGVLLLGSNSSISTYGGVTNINAAGQVQPQSPYAFGLSLVNVNAGGNIYMVYGPGGSTGYTYANNFNLSGTAIHTGGGKTHSITGAVVLTGNTSINEDGSSGILFGSTVSSPGNYNLSFGQSATFQGSVSLGSGLITGGGTAYLQPPAATTITVSSINVSGGVVHNGGGTTILSMSNSYTGGTTITYGTLSFSVPHALPDGTALTLNTNGTGVVPANSGAPIVLVTSSLKFAGSTSTSWTGKLDLNNNDMIVQAGSLANVTSQVAQGYSGGGWNAAGGIVSTTAANDATHLHALGVILNDNPLSPGNALYGSGGAPLGSTFEGASTIDGDVLVKYTYYGDANLDGHIDGSDYSIVDSSFGSELNTGNKISGWYFGDFNYDGVVNGSDYTLMDNAFNQQGASIAAQLATPSAAPSALIGSGSAVPEPTTLSLLAIGAIGLLGRRRRPQATSH